MQLEGKSPKLFALAAFGLSGLACSASFVPHSLIFILAWTNTLALSLLAIPLPDVHALSYQGIFFFVFHLHFSPAVSALKQRPPSPRSLTVAIS